VNVPNFGPGTNPARLRDWARVVEGLGYDLLMVSDHVVITRSEHIPRIQEAQASAYHVLRELVEIAG